MTTPPTYEAPVPGQPKPLAQQFQASQALLAAVLIRDVLSLWTGMGTRDVRTVWPAVKRAIDRLITERFSLSALLGSQFYADQRIAQGVAGTFPAIVPALPSAIRRSATLDATGPWSMLKSIQGGKTAQEALSSAGVRIGGAAAYLALEGAREAVLQSVQEDPEALAWMRETTSGHPCAFCAMLESRGAVYKSEQSASFEAHDHCACVAVPIFTKETIKLLRDNDLKLQWEKVTRGKSGNEARKAWRRYWDNQGMAA